MSRVFGLFGNVQRNLLRLFGKLFRQLQKQLFGKLHRNLYQFLHKLYGKLHRRLSGKLYRRVRQRLHRRKSGGDYRAFGRKHCHRTHCESDGLY